MNKPNSFSRWENFQFSFRVLYRDLKRTPSRLATVAFPLLWFDFSTRWLENLEESALIFRAPENRDRSSVIHGAMLHAVLLGWGPTVCPNKPPREDIKRWLIRRTWQGPCTTTRSVVSLISFHSTRSFETIFPLTLSLISALRLLMNAYSSHDSDGGVRMLQGNRSMSWSELGCLMASMRFRTGSHNGNQALSRFAWPFFTHWIRLWKVGRFDFDRFEITNHDSGVKNTIWQLSPIFW